MTARSLNLVLLALCLGLLGTLGFTLYLLSDKSGNRAALRPEIISNTVTQRQLAIRKVATADLLSTLQAHDSLRWSAIESTNYIEYMFRLHAIGCPDETVRDIIVTDLSKLYARKRAAVLQQQKYEYWNRDGWEQGMDPDIRAQLRALEDEQTELVADLLGVDLRTQLGKYWGATEVEQDRTLGFLDSTKRAAVTEIRRRYGRVLDEIYDQSGEFMLPEDQLRVRKLELGMQEELAETLSPQEFEDYQMRNSPTAEALRDTIGAFDVTEGEFRELYRLHQTFERQYDGSFDPRDPDALLDRERTEMAAKAALEEEISKVLGSDRYDDYVRGQDEDYQQLIRLADRLEMPEGVAQEVYNMRKTAEEQKQRLLADRTLSNAQRQRALLAVADEVEASMASAMGADSFEAYQSTARLWMSELVELEDSPPPLENQVIYPPLPPGVPVP